MIINNKQNTGLAIPKIAAFLVALTLFLLSATAQNEGQYTHFMYNRLSYNPAFAGSTGDISATVLYRSQWMGLQLQASTPNGEAGEKPTNMLFSFDLPVRWLHGGIGGTFTSEKVGYHDNSTFAIDYAFRIFWGAGTLSAGIEADLQNYKFKTSNLFGTSDMTGDPTNPTNSANDPLVSAKDVSDFLIDVSTGIYYQVPSTFYVGLAAKNLLASKSDELNIRNTRTFYLIGGYAYTFPYNPSLKLKPSALLKTANFSIFQADFACLLDYENIFWGGLGYRLGDAVNFLAGVNFLKVMQFGVAYDLTTSKLGFANGRSIGSLELYLNVHLQFSSKKRPPTVSGNTLYLR